MKELNSSAKAILKELGTRDGPSTSDRERVRRKLMSTFAAAGTLAGSSAALSAKAASLAAATVTAAGVAGAGAAKFGLAQVALWLVAGGVVGTAVTFPASKLQEQGAPSPGHSAALVGTGTVPADGAARPAVARPRTAPALLSAEIPPTESSPADPAPGQRSMNLPLPRQAPVPSNVGTALADVQHETSRPANITSSLSRELSMLKSAQRELASGDPAASLEVLDEHARVFPQSALTAERTAARAFALCALGRTQEARDLAREFLEAAPTSPLVPRLLASCAGGEHR
jgi:hypothetical protein